MVMDQGKLVEFDSPNKLLEREDSIFYGMAKESGLVVENTIVPDVIENKRRSIQDIFKSEGPSTTPKIFSSLEPGETLINLNDDEELVKLILKGSDIPNEGYDQVDGKITEELENKEDHEGYTTAEEDRPNSPTPPPSPVEEKDHMSDS